MGAAVLVLHEPTGNIYKTFWLPQEGIMLPHLELEVPIKITLSYVGLKTEEFSDVYIQLGKPFVIEVSPAETNAQLSEVVVSGATRRGALISKDRKGTSTNIN